MLLSKFLRSLGVFLFIAISVISIMTGHIAKEFKEESYFRYYIETVTSFENRFYDYRMKSHLLDAAATAAKSKDIVLIDIDDKSIQKINSWPIPRENWATLLNNLKSFGVKVVAFDIIFPEPAASCTEISPDDIFKDAITNFQENGQRVILSYSVQETGHPDDFFNEIPVELYNNIVDSKLSDENKSFVPKFIEKHNWPIQKLLEPEPDLGYLNMEEDADGVFRHYNLVANVDNIFFPSLAMRSFMSFKGSHEPIFLDSMGYGSMPIGENRMFFGYKAETKIRWIGGENTFSSIPLYEVLYAKPTNTKIKDILDGKIAIIGSTTTGAHDLRNTPIDPKTPGVYAHMNALNMLLTGHAFKPQQDSIVFSLYLLAGAMIILIVVMFFNKAILDLFTLLFILGSIYAIDYYYFVPKGYELRLFFTFFSLISTYSWVTFLNFNQASNEKKYIKGAFSRFVAPAVVNDMIDNPDKLKVGGERKDITVMFSDVRDFTSISEKLSATELAKCLNRYMGEMTDIVFETNGTLDKYIGDAIVAFWGAPIDIGDHVNYAMDAAVKMLEALPAINVEFKEQGFPEFKIGLGLNSGECSVGNMGSDQIFAYTALGDNMNLGARLEALCKHYGAQILVSEYTYERMDQEKYVSRLIDNVRVKGKTEPVGVYEVLYNYHPFTLNPNALIEFKRGWELFVNQDFTAAKNIFEQILSEIPTDKASQRLKEACIKWIETPPREDEDHTITTMTTK